MAVPEAPAGRVPDAGPALDAGERHASRPLASRAAVVALVVGAVSMFVGVLGPVAIVVGLRAWRRGGGWLALFGLVVGSLSTGFSLLGIIHYLLLVLR